MTMDEGQDKARSQLKIRLSAVIEGLDSEDMKLLLALALRLGRGKKGTVD